MRPQRRGWLTWAWFLFGIAPTAAGHDTWIAAEATSVAAGQICRFDVTSGMSFPVLEFAIRPERLTRAEVRLAQHTFALGAPRSQARALVLAATLAEEGIASVWVELAPKQLELSSAQVDEYLREIGMAETLGPAWRQRPEPKRWRETYTKHAKTFVRVGQRVGDESWRDPVGMALELVPDADPSGLRAGQPFGLRLLKDGQPLAGVAVAADPGGRDARTFKTTDADGRVRFEPAHAGRYLFAATQLRPLADGSWASDFTTLTVWLAASP